MASYVSDFPLDVCQGTIRLLDGAEHVRIPFTDERTEFEVRLHEDAGRVTVEIGQHLKLECTVAKWAQSVFEFLSAINAAHPAGEYKRAWLHFDFPWEAFSSLCEKMDRVR